MPTHDLTMDTHRTSRTPLASTELDVAVTDLVADYTIRHRFRNIGHQAIEAIFSFPVPFDAAFLGMHVTLGGELVVAEVRLRTAAARTYDDALTSGDSAVLLSMLEPGVLCIALGNLLPGESGEIELRFAAGLSVADGTARFSLPLVHRPRCGKWSPATPEMPGHDFAVEHPMSATIRVRGLLADAPVQYAAHPARFARHGDTLEMHIDAALLDRDLAITFALDAAPRPTCRVIEDGDAALGLATFVLPPDTSPQPPLNLCLLLDASASMHGEAIRQSRRAVQAIAAALDETDRIQVLRFGSQVVPIFRQPTGPTAATLDALDQAVDAHRANLGDAVLSRALTAALDHLPADGTGRARAIILITNGATQPDDTIETCIALCSAQVRVFVITIGSGAGTEALQQLAALTRGVLEHAAPAEPMAACALRQLRRTRLASHEIQVTWPFGVMEAVPPGAAYAGDTVTVAARMPASIRGQVEIHLPTADFALRMPLGAPESAPALRALIGQRIYLATTSDDAEAISRRMLVEQMGIAESELPAFLGSKKTIALRYGLLTQETSVVLVKRRADGDKPVDYPEIVAVAPMVPAGTVAGDDDDELLYAYHAGDEDDASDAVGADDTANAGLPDREFALSELPDDAQRGLTLRLYREVLKLLTAVPLDDLAFEPAILRLPPPFQGAARQLLGDYIEAIRNGTPEPRAVCHMLKTLNPVLREPPFTEAQQAILAAAERLRTGPW